MCLATFALFGTGGVIGTHGRVAGAYVIVYACLVRESDSRAVRRVIRIQLHRLFRRRLLHCCVLFSRFFYAVLHLLMLLWYLVLQLLLLYQVLQLLRFVLSQALCLRVFVRSLGGFLRGCGLSTHMCVCVCARTCMRKCVCQCQEPEWLPEGVWMVWDT